jgi:hypothetical protein
MALANRRDNDFGDHMDVIWLRNLETVAPVAGPVPDGIRMHRAIDFPIDTAINNNVSVAARTFFLNHNLVAQEIGQDNGLSAVFTGSSMIGAANNGGRVALMLKSIADLLFRNTYTNFLARAQENYEKTLVGPQAFSRVGPSQCGYLGGLAVPLSLDVYSGFWPMLFLPEQEKITLPKSHPAVTFLRDRTAVADYIYAVRSSVDYVNSMYKVSESTIQDSAAADELSEWIQIRENTTGDIRTHVHPMYLQSLVFRTQAALCGIEIADLCVPVAEHAMRELRCDATFSDTISAQAALLQKARVPQYLRTDTIQMYLDATINNFEPTQEAINLMKTANWQGELNLTTGTGLEKIASPEHRPEQELLLMAFKFGNYAVHQFRYVDHPEKSSADVVFADYQNGNADYLYAPIALRYAPGARIQPATFHHTNAAAARAVVRVASIVTAPPNVLNARADMQSIGNYRVTGNTYYVTTPTTIPMPSVSPSTAATLLTEEILRNAPPPIELVTPMDFAIQGNAASTAQAGAMPSLSTPTIDMVQVPAGAPAAQLLKTTANPILRNPVGQASVLSHAVTKTALKKKVCFQAGYEARANGTHPVREALIGNSI